MITTTQVIEALQTLKEFCEQQDDNDPCSECLLDKFCRRHGAPNCWEIPQERTEE